MRNAVHDKAAGSSCQKIGDYTDLCGVYLVRTGDFLESPFFKKLYLSEATLLFSRFLIIMII
jgi:hypothetical protein